MEIIFDQKLDGFALDETYGCYVTWINPTPFVLDSNKTYTVGWDGVVYVCEPFVFNAGTGDKDCVAIGTKLLAGGEHTGEPFGIVYDLNYESVMAFFSIDTKTSHSIIIALESVAGADILLYDKIGKKQTFETIDKIIVDTPDSEQGATFTYGAAVKNAEYELDFSNENQKVTLEKGQLLKEFTIIKPTNLISEHVKKNVDISGVIGNLAYIEDIETESKMNSLLVEANIGNAYRYIGETTDNYINGDIYVVEDNV